MTATPDFLLLVAALLDDLAVRGARDATLLQLHALFGPMLSSALQLVDRREVVRVLLPGGRTVHQVTSSTGAPYTLYLDLPPRHVVKVEVEGQGGKEGSGDAREGEVAAHVDGATREGKRLEAAYPAPADNEPTRGRTASLSPPASPTPARKAASDVTRGPDAPGSPTHPHAAVAEDTSPPPPAAKDDRNDADNSHHISPLAARLGHMFCPCTGFAYNSLTGERNVFCKHILAVLLMHQLGRSLETEVALAPVAGLIGAAR